MTRLDALEIQEQRLRAIVELAPACLARVTRDATVLAMNAAARTMLGASDARDVLKKSLLTFATAEDGERLRVFVEQGCDGKAASLELSMVSLAGDAREIEASVVALPARGDAAPTALLTFRDISGYRRLEGSLIETARAEAENAAREAAERAREMELRRARGEADDAAHVATALREAAIRDAARLEELEARLIELDDRCRRLTLERDAQIATTESARADARGAGVERDDLRRQLDEHVARAQALDEQRQPVVDDSRLTAERDELKRTLDRARAEHATEMAVAFADRAALERRVQNTEAKQRRFDAEIARLTAERDGAARSLAESQQHEQRARRWIAHWIELERAMQRARADLQELAEWLHGRNGHESAADTAMVRQPPAVAAHPAAGDAPWN